MSVVGVDKTGYSLSYNEFLTLVSTKRREEPNEGSLLSAFLSVCCHLVLIVLGLCRTFDCGETGKIPERKFRQIMKTKGVPESDVKEMLDGNFRSSIKAYLAFVLSIEAA